MRSNPTRFAEELQDTLHQMIIADFSEWSRRSFWDEMLDRRGRVSIFTGALHNEPIGRDMIGDWDLRAASELTSFFASHQYRATIESPVYQIEQVTKKRSEVEGSVPEKTNYISTLEGLLTGKNCIIIASPDVNPFTEILLGKLYEVERGKWFSHDKVEDFAGAVVAFKETDASKSTANGNNISDYNILHERAFSRLESSTTDKGPLRRGFRGHGVVPHGCLSGEFLSQKDATRSFTVHAHLVIAKNPFPPDSDHHVIILNGVSGPATFALTHVLTGGTSTQFVAYESTFDSDVESEAFLQQVNQDIEMIRQKKYRGVQYFIEVKVGPPKEEKDATVKHIFDWRRILSWKRIGKTYIYYPQDTAT